MARPRAHVVDLELEPVDPLRVAELVARVHGWVKTGPTALAAVQNVVRAAPRAGRDAEFVHLMNSIERATQETRA